MADDVEAARAADPAAGEGLSERLTDVAVSLLKFAQDRLDLLRWEAAHEGSRLGSMLLRGFCAALLALFTLESLALLLVATVWDTAWRLQVMCGITVLASIGTAVMVRAFLAKLNEKSGLLHRPAPLAENYVPARPHEPA